MHKHTLWRTHMQSVARQNQRAHLSFNTDDSFCRSRCVNVHGSRDCGFDVIPNFVADLLVWTQTRYTYAAVELSCPTMDASALTSQLMSWRSISTAREHP